MKKINVVVAGLGFGSAFVPIYVHHPAVASVGVYDSDEARSREASRQFGITRIYKNFEEILEDDTVDAVHLVSPIPCHAEQTIRVLRSGKHCACTVPMATSLRDIEAIIEATDSSGRNYMMMETAVYTSHFFAAREMVERGEMGTIQFLRGAHYQDMEYWPDYWMGLPPMHYGTHAIAPLVLLAGSPIVRTHCLGSGILRGEFTAQYGNPFPVECALFEFKNGLKAEVTRSLFQTARQYTESFNVYGDKKSFEWQQIEAEGRPVIFILGEPRLDEEGRPLRGLPVAIERITPPNRHALLPPEVQRFTVRAGDYDETNPQKSLERDASGGHGGSHPHLVHEFVTSILEGRKPRIHERIAANITAAGICAHESAMKGGGEVDVPDFGCRSTGPGKAV